MRVRYFFGSKIVLRFFLKMLLVAMCFIELVGCRGMKSERWSLLRDGPPAVNFDIRKIVDAEPKVESVHPYGARDYVLWGKKYSVLKQANGYVKKGYASWYGTKFHGRLTSIQERYNLYEMTAASKELPLPSYVQVTNLSNGRRAIVRVNDRGPFHSNRIIDLSYAAAKKLGFAEKGLALVKVAVIDPKNWKQNDNHSRVVCLNETIRTNETIKENAKFLQVGAFVNYENAKKLSNKLRLIVDDQISVNMLSDLYKVQIGPIVNISNSDALRLRLEQNGYKNVVLMDGNV